MIRVVRESLPMPSITRRTFAFSGAAAALAGSTLPRSAHAATPLGLTLGLQLYSVREMLQQAYEGTLRKVAALGYEEVEAAGFFGHSPAQVKQAMTSANLRCVSGHYPWNELSPRSTRSSHSTSSSVRATSSAHSRALRIRHG